MPQAPPLPPHRWTRAEYDEMVEAGLFAGRPFELLDGVVVETVSPDDPHQWVTMELMGLLAPVAAVRRLVVQGPIAAGEYSEPEPDLAIYRHSRQSKKEPGVVLAIEVAVSDQATPRYKIDVYPLGDVAEYWIVDVPARAVEVHDDLRDGRYRRRRVLRGDDVLTVPEFGITTTVEGVFARAGV